MRKVIYNLLTFLLICFIISSCRESYIETPDFNGMVVLEWGSSSSVEVSTKSTLGFYPENRVQNLYIFVFDNHGRKLYGKWFDAEDLVPQNQFNSVWYGNTTKECWWVNNSSNSDTPTSGACRIKLSEGNNYRIYAIANLDADMVNVSSDRLSHEIHSIDDLQKMKATLNQNVIERNGYFPMTGDILVNISSNGTVSLAPGANTSSSGLELKRIDAKVRFVFLENTELLTFTAEQWRVVNVPRSTYILSYSGRDKTADSGEDAGVCEEDFFDTEFVNFEEFPTPDRSEFSFYMTENRMTPKMAPTTYHQRDKQIKLDSGLNGPFEYAHDFSTYVEVTGSVVMKLDNSDAGQTLGGKVKYLIHLGDFSNKVGDYNTLRNHSYTYTVHIDGVESIRVEVETNIENQPGATGSVTIAKEEIAICDAHYVTKTLTFHAKNISDELTWYVNTPFSEGGPQYINGNIVIAGLDYQWVHFRLNDKDENNIYRENRKDYTTTPYSLTNPDGLMDINQLVQYIKEQKNIFNEQPLVSDFDSSTDPKICVTAFVDEYYYDSHPLTGEIRTDLWKEFVNQNDRLMHILCDSYVSRDKESMMNGSVITIQQRSIQTIYNTDMGHTLLQRAWGTERVDESGNWSYNINSNDLSTSGKNTDRFNGLKNTLYEWGMYNGTNFTSGVRWSNYLNNEVNNDTPQLLSNYQSLRYSCLTRNRDNNGNGIIDLDEIVWYMASEKQLVGLFMGDDVIESKSKLYNRTEAQKMSADPNQWRQHIISSTKHSSRNEPLVVWGEEGISTGQASGSKSWGGVNHFTMRCVRNLGIERSEGLNTAPDDYIVMSGDSESGYVFETTHLNPAVLRYYTSRDLDMDDERSAQNKLYNKFQVAPLAIQKADFQSIGFKEFHRRIDETSSVVAGFCPEGYRVPNQREMAIMISYLSDKEPNLVKNVSFFARTYFSMGGYNEKSLRYANIHVSAGSPNNGETGKMGFVKDSDNLSVNPKNVVSARCVRDVRE